MTQAAVLAQMGNTNQTFRNRIINGAMLIDQRNAGASGTASAYAIDRWSYVATQASKGTWGQNLNSASLPSGFTKYLGFQTGGSGYSVLTGDTFAFMQPIEGFNFADMGFGTANAKPVTLSFWVYSSITGTFGGSLNNGNAGGYRSYPFNYTVSSANTWTQISVTISGDTSGTWLTNNGLGCQVWFGLGSGATFSGSAGSWAGANYVQPTGSVSVVGTANATFYITGVQLELGTKATPFENRLYGTELALCQRYFEQSYDIGTVAGTVTTTGAGFSYVQGPAGFTNGSIYVPYKVTKRASATVTTYSTQTGTSGKMYSAANTSDYSTSLIVAGNNGFGAYWTQGSTTSINAYMHWSASSEL